ncbi:MAG: hypothetical protein H6754_00140 [Candidatus Omnitrophica bacterium]|nr:hypothetical protein [Candidatus Omnitrophota bacterium]
MFKGPVPTKKVKAKRSTSQSRYVGLPAGKKNKKTKAKESSSKSATKRRRFAKSYLKSPVKKPIKIKTKAIKSVAINKLKRKEKIVKPVPEFYVGEITHYFQKISVVVVKVSEHPILIGDLIHIKGGSTDFTQKVASLQVESKDVRFARKGELVGLQVIEIAKPGDKVYKIKK